MLVLVAILGMLVLVAILGMLVLVAILGRLVLVAILGMLVLLGLRGMCGFRDLIQVPLAVWISGDLCCRPCCHHLLVCTPTSCITRLFGKLLAEHA